MYYYKNCAKKCNGNAEERKRREARQIICRVRQPKFIADKNAFNAMCTTLQRIMKYKYDGLNTWKKPKT